MPRLSRSIIVRIFIIGIVFTTALNTMVAWYKSSADSISGDYNDKMNPVLPEANMVPKMSNENQANQQPIVNDFDRSIPNAFTLSITTRKNGVGLSSTDNTDNFNPVTKARLNKNGVGLSSTDNTDNFKTVNKTRLIKNAFLVIGVPTRKRLKASYLIQTLRELIEGLDDEEKKEVIIVVLITDFNLSSIESVQREVLGVFSKEISSGLLQVIRAPKSFYPSLEKLPRLWNDKPQRIKWRSKQCLDYAFLFNYSKDLGQYYLQVEDDVSTVNGYLKEIKNFITANQNHSWSMLEFGARGFIGMMYRASDVGRLATFVKMYFWVFPIDILFRQFNDFHLYGNPKWAKYQPPLFLHVGAVSSLDGQVRKLEDIENAHRIYKDSSNPPAKVSTSIGEYIKDHISAAYSTHQHGVFWGKTVKQGDFFLIQFHSPVRISKFIVEAGGSKAPEDFFGGARVLYGPRNGKGQCENFIVWQEFDETGQIELRSNDDGGTQCQCLKIEITKIRKDKKGRPRWLAIREIAVWVP